MKKVPPISGKYSVIEIALDGQDLRAKEKASARELLLSCRIPERSLVASDYKGVFRLSCYTRSAKKVQEIRKCYRLLGKKSFAVSGSLSDIDVVITDSGISPSFAKELKKRKIDLLT